MSLVQGLRGCQGLVQPSRGSMLALPRCLQPTLAAAPVIARTGWTAPLAGRLRQQGKGAMPQENPSPFLGCQPHHPLAHELEELLPSQLTMHALGILCRPGARRSGVN